MNHSSSIERQRRRSSESPSPSSRATGRHSSQRRPRELISSSSSLRNLDLVDHTHNNDARRRRVSSSSDLAAPFHASENRSSGRSMTHHHHGSRSNDRHDRANVVRRERDSSQIISRVKPQPRRSSSPPPVTPVPLSSRHDPPKRVASPPSSSSKRSEYSVRAANYVDRILNESRPFVNSNEITPKTRDYASSVDHSLLALPIVRERGGRRNDDNHSTADDERPTLRRGKYSSRHSSLMSLCSDRRYSDMDRIRSRNEDSRSKTRRSSAESVDDQLLLLGKRSSDLDDKIKKSVPRFHSRNKTGAEERIDTNSIQREDAITVSRSHAEMSQRRDRARAHSQEPRYRNHVSQRSQRSTMDAEVSTPLRSSNSVDGVGISAGTSSYLPKHSIRNQQGASRKSRNPSQERSGGLTRSRSLSQDRREATTRGSLSASNKSCTNLPSSSASSSHSQQRSNRSKSPTSQDRRIPPPPPPPPRRSSTVSDSTVDTGASERLLLLSKKMSILKNKNAPHSHRRSSSAGLSAGDDIYMEDGDRVMNNARKSTSERNLVQLDQQGIARLPPTKAAAYPSRHSESDNSATPSFVSLSTQSQTTGPTSPDSSKDVIACNPQGVPFRCTRRSSDNPPPPPPRTLTRRPSNAREIMLSSLESSKLMMSSCPTLNIPMNDEYGTWQAVHNAAVPAAVICPDNDPDTKSNKKLNNVTKCSRKVSKMAYTDPFGDSGLYTGEVDEESRPHGKGKMKYDNGIYFEGTWYYGCKNDRMGLKNNGISTMGGANTACLQQDGSTRERILSGFTSWKGKKSADSSGNGEKGRFVYGMEWVDPSGLSGKYTGRVNDADVPDGKGVMRYHFGLIAEGDWIKGVLNNGAGAGVNPLVAGNPGGLSGAMSVAPGMSVAGGGGGAAMSVVSGLGMMSIGGGGGALGGMGGFYPPTPSVAAGVYNSMVNPYANMMAAMPPNSLAAAGNSIGPIGYPVGYFPQQPQMMHYQVSSGPRNDTAIPPS